MALTVCPSPYARTLRKPPASLTYGGGGPAAELAGPPATRPARVAPATATMTIRAGLRTRRPPVVPAAVCSIPRRRLRRHRSPFLPRRAGVGLRRDRPGPARHRRGGVPRGRLRRAAAGGRPAGERRPLLGGLALAADATRPLVGGHRLDGPGLRAGRLVAGPGNLVLV